jgi:hypothetical protein
MRDGEMTAPWMDCMDRIGADFGVVFLLMFIGMFH